MFFFELLSFGSKTKKEHFDNKLKTTTISQVVHYKLGEPKAPTYETHCKPQNITKPKVSPNKSVGEGER